MTRQGTARQYASGVASIDRQPRPIGEPAVCRPSVTGIDAGTSLLVFPRSRRAGCGALDNLDLYFVQVVERSTAMSVFVCSSAINKDQLMALTNPRDALHHGERAANKWWTLSVINLRPS